MCRAAKTPDVAASLLGGLQQWGCAADCEARITTT
jgi:hypothetical protein